MDILIPEDDFNAALWKRFNEGKIRNVYPKSKYNDILNKIKISEEKPPCNSPEEYYLLRKFVVAKVGQKERLVCKGEPGTGSNGSNEDAMSKVRFYVALEEIYDFVDKAHKTTKHGGRDKIVRILHQQGIVNITRDTVELFLSFCQICRPKRKELSRRFSSRNVTLPATSADLVNNDSISVVDTALTEQHSNNINKDTIKTEVDMVDVQHHLNQNITDFTRAQINILDFTSAPDGDYKFIMVYQDYQTFFCILRPLKCKCTYEVVVHLLDIFTLIGAPQILYSDCDAHFLSSVIHELKCSWPDCVVVSGSERFRNAELQNNAEKYISEVHEMLRTWMVQNNSARWSFGLKLVQFRKNTKIAENDRSPYDAFFGHSVHTGIPPHLDISLLANAQKEDDLRSVVNNQKTAESEEYEHLQVSLDPNICSLVQNNSILNGSCSDAQLPQSDKIKDNINIKIEPIDDPEESHSDRMIASEALAELSDTSIKRTEMSQRSSCSILGY